VAVPLSPVLAELTQYPFARLDDWKADARARGIELIDFGMGDPREVTPPFIREAMLASVEAVSSYPRATGLPELREAVARWIGARFDVDVDEATEIVPTLGSKEAIFSFAQIALGEKRLVAVPEPGYPVYERGALFAGGKVVTVPLSESNGWLPSTRGTRSRSSGSATRTTRPAPSHRSPSTRSSPRVLASTAFCSVPTRRTRSCGSTSRRRPRYRSPTGPTSSSSIRSRSARR
jgi:DNA-binding transcriptional MocR family regulator